jgi:cyclophilin family peptidyl-prolyl cis-trans isomerase
MRPAIAIFCLILAGVVLAAMVSLRTPHPDPLPGEVPPPTPPASKTPTKAAAKPADKDQGDPQSRFDKAREGAVRATLEIGSEIPDRDDPKKKVFTSKGTMEIELYPKAAPKTVAHLTELAGKNFWDGIKVHRLDSEVVQMGDPESRDADVSDFDLKGIGTHGSGSTVPLEVADKLPNLQYTLGLARAQDPNSGESQFYINLVDNPAFDYDYCVFGRIVKGTDIVAKIAKGDVIKHLQIYDHK